MTRKEKNKMLKGIIAGYDAVVEDSIETRSSDGTGKQGGWNKGKNDRVSRGQSPEAWAEYQRRVEWVW